MDVRNNQDTLERAFFFPPAVLTRTQQHQQAFLPNQQVQGKKGEKRATRDKGREREGGKCEIRWIHRVEARERERGRGRKKGEES